MTVKYHCPKCDRRFVDWGAEKLEFTCPDCREDLVVLGGTTGKTKSKPSLRRPVPAAASGPRRVTSFGSSDDGDDNSGGDDFDSDSDGSADFDDDDSDVDISGDDDAAAVDDSDD